MNILIPILTLSVLGFLFGLGLAFASKKFCVKSDPKLQEIFKHIPGANCGACGMPGCMGFAEGLIRGKCSIEQCTVMQEKQREKIAEILGIKTEKRVKRVATLHCNGGKKVKDKFIYNGLKDCIAANMIMQGQKECLWGCLGFGSCVNACPFEAIIMTEEGLPRVLEEKCRSCGRCVQICPKNLFTLVPEDKKVYVACSSHDSGKDTRAFCSVGCIACHRCEKACKYDAIHVIDAFDKSSASTLSGVERVDNLAVIDYNKCTSCGECVKVCPTKTIRIKDG